MCCPSLGPAYSQLPSFVLSCRFVARAWRIAPDAEGHSVANMTSFICLQSTFVMPVQCGKAARQQLRSLLRSVCYVVSASRGASWLASVKATSGSKQDVLQEECCRMGVWMGLLGANPQAKGGPLAACSGIKGYALLLPVLTLCPTCILTCHRWSLLLHFTKQTHMWQHKPCHLYMLRF